jgi:uncharacterized protein involved in exopolysaccharide biosynthesis
MAKPGAERSSDANQDGDEDEFDLDRLKEILGFVVRAPRRRKRLAVAALVLTLVIGFLTARYWPRSYTCETRILAQRNLVLPALDNPTRAVPHDADAPTKNAADSILKQDNLVAAVKQLDIIDRWEATRQPLLRVKDNIFGGLSKKPEDERIRDMVGLLEKRLLVGSDESSITIVIDWPDRDMAFEIVSYVEKNFLEARYDNNVNVILEAIQILEERAKPQAAEVDAALAELTKLEAERTQAAMRAAGVSTAPPGPATTPRPAPPRPAAATTPDESDSDAAQELQEVRRRIRALRDDRDRQIAEAQRQLTDARATLGPLHPTVVGLNEKLLQLQETPAELKELDARERALVAQLAGAKAAAAPPAPTPAPLAPRAPAPSPSATAPPTPPPGLHLDLRDDSKTALARARLQTASTKYNELLSRMEAARIELEVTRAAFKYQYTVIRPPELPRRPSKPNAMLLYAGTVLLAIVLAFLLPGLVDLWRGRFIEAWQVERRLKLPILGDLTPPPS